MKPTMLKSEPCPSAPRRTAVFGVFLLGLLASQAVPAAELALWYDKPAARWEQEALPIGNGRLAAMIFGGMQKERLQFNEESAAAFATGASISPAIQPRWWCCDSRPTNPVRSPAALC